LAVLKLLELTDALRMEIAAISMDLTDFVTLSVQMMVFITLMKPSAALLLVPMVSEPLWRMVKWNTVQGLWIIYKDTQWGL
jgi:hypothetical protein